MKKTVVASVAIVALAVLVGLYVYSENRRYYMQPSGRPGIVYKIDRRTGRTWLLKEGSEVLIGEPAVSKKPTSPEEKAMSLAKNARNLSSVRSNADAIKSRLNEAKGPLKILGWMVRKADDQTYVVSYTWETAAGLSGQNFEVNMAAEIVRLIDRDEELCRKYGVPTPTPSRPGEVERMVEELEQLLKKERDR